MNFATVAVQLRHGGTGDSRGMDGPGYRPEDAGIVQGTHQEGQSHRLERVSIIIFKSNESNWSICNTKCCFAVQPECLSLKNSLKGPRVLWTKWWR